MMPFWQLRSFCILNSMGFSHSAGKWWSWKRRQQQHGWVIRTSKCSKKHTAMKRFSNSWELRGSLETNWHCCSTSWHFVAWLLCGTRDLKGISQMPNAGQHHDNNNHSFANIFSFWHLDWKLLQLLSPPVPHTIYNVNLWVQQFFFESLQGGNSSERDWSLPLPAKLLISHDHMKGQVYTGATCSSCLVCVEGRELKFSVLLQVAISLAKC